MTVSYSLSQKSLLLFHLNMVMPERNVAEYVQLADDEAIVKDYYVATVRKPSYGEAHFALTNKRLIMYVWSEKTVQVNSAELQDVRSTDIYWSKRQRMYLGIGLLISGAIFSILSILASLSGIYSFLILLIITVPVSIIGIYYIYKVRNILVIIINVKAATGAFTFYSYSKSALEKGWNPEKLELDANPAPDSKIMAQEIGGLIINLQKELQL